MPLREGAVPLYSRYAVGYTLDGTIGEVATRDGLSDSPYVPGRYGAVHRRASIDRLVWRHGAAARAAHRVHGRRRAVTHLVLRRRNAQARLFPGQEPSYRNTRRPNAYERHGCPRG